MVSITKTSRSLPFYSPIPLTDLPLIYRPEHLFPYTSYGETETIPITREFEMVVMENASVRAEIAPELGGRVYSLFDKRIDREVLFSNPVVKPTRILPIWAFISGGIEFNFPIAHSPTSVARVGCTTGTIGDYGFVRVGEREARTGMEWVVELGLAADKPFLIHRTWLRNLSGADHPWMMWTIAAVPSTERTEFVHPPHRVLVHDDVVRELDWPGDGLNWDMHYRQMTALFWKPGSSPTFGAFHHDLGFGLLHQADAAQLPGKKVWTYGHGRHRCWGQATTEGGASYCEIESGPLFDQSEKPLFPNGAEKKYLEFWVPVTGREDFDTATMPELDLPDVTDPWLGWAHSNWQTEWEAFRRCESPLPASAVPTGLALETALRRELKEGNLDAAEPLALWLAFHGRPSEALAAARLNLRPTTRRVAGLILWKALGEKEKALVDLEAGPLHDPVAVVELDELYAELGRTEKRARLLEHAPAHRLVIERRADLALLAGQPGEALRLLGQTPWPREHQRYVRTALWRKAQAALGHPDAEPPESLNEDNLASFGAYWSEPPPTSRSTLSDPRSH